MERRSLFESIFGKTKIQEKPQEKGLSAFKLLNTYTSTFYNYDGNMWQMDIIRSSIDAIARNMAKLKPKHIRYETNGKLITAKSNIEKLLQFKPNKDMEAYSFWYKVCANYFINNNAFIYPMVDERNQIVAFYPILAPTVELLENSSNGEMYVRFIFRNGHKYACPYKEIIHLRNQFYDNDIFGSSNSALDSILQTITTFNQSMSISAQLISVVRGILKTSTVTKSEDLNAKRDKFIQDNLAMSSGGGSGVLILDEKMDYTPITQSANNSIPKEQIEYVKNAIYNYFGVNENIIQNKYNEDQWEAFYEGRLEPMALQFGQAFTNFCFSDREIGFGNELILEANRLQCVSNKTKLQLVKELGALGILTINEAREIFNLGSVEGGEKRLVSLNFVNADKADEYQGVDDPNKDDPSKEGESND